MNRIPMSKAGTALLRAFLSRALVETDRILLTDYRSSDWQSLTFVGERHEMRFRIPGPDAQKTYDSLTSNLTDDEFALPRQILADIAVFGAPVTEPDGSISFGLEALTIAD